MDYWIEILAVRDGEFYPSEEIPDLWRLETPAQLAHATLTLANSRIDNLICRFPNLRNRSKKLVKRLIPDLETFVMIVTG